MIGVHGACLVAKVRLFGGRGAANDLDSDDFGGFRAHRESCRRFCKREVIEAESRMALVSRRCLAFGKRNGGRLLTFEFGHDFELILLFNVKARSAFDGEV